MNLGPRSPRAAIMAALFSCASIAAHAQQAQDIRATAMQGLVASAQDSQSMQHAHKAATKNVTYEVKVEQDGKLVSTLTVMGLLGSALARDVTTERRGTDCQFTDALGIKSDVKFSLNDEMALTLVPAVETDGGVATLMMAQVTQAKPTAGAMVGDCMVASGESRTIGAVGTSPLHKGESYIFKVGDRTRFIVKLTELQG
ncbi:hypothetical protein [Paraburkholderia domus]|uniref:hypothetical protein n=1 Tax=Paraburkholderia domus TaxID=2793075 RepID=UPI001B8A9EF2|nr:hypothetical protein [Paraburkholderia domus]